MSNQSAQTILMDSTNIPANSSDIGISSIASDSGLSIPSVVVPPLKPQPVDKPQPALRSQSVSSSESKPQFINQSPAQPKTQVFPQKPSNSESSAQVGSTLEHKPIPEVKRPLVYWEQAQSILLKIEEKVSGKVISYYTSGILADDDVKYFHTVLRKIGFQQKLFFILNSGGGDGKSAYRIASLLRSFCDEFIVVIPEKAASAATMLALAADQIIMTPLAYLTAVDTSLVHPLNPKDKNNNPVRLEIEEIKRAIALLLQGKEPTQDNIEIYKTIFNYIHPAAFGSMERLSTLSEMLCKDIIELRRNQLPSDITDMLIKKLNRDYPSHGYPITKTKAKQLGLNVVDSDMNLDNLLWSYVNTQRILTEPIRTDFNDSYFHVEKNINIIESVGQRTLVRNIYEKRLDPIIKGWTNLKDEYKWMAFYEVEENGKKVVRGTFVDF